MKNKKDKKSFDFKKRIGYAVYNEALKLGILLRPLGDVIYFNPPLNITKKEMEDVVFKCRQAVNKILN